MWLAPCVVSERLRSGHTAALLKDAVCRIEVHYVRDLIDQRARFDTIYHDILCYFSGTALNAFP